MENKTVFDLFLLGGWVMWPLLLFSVLTVTILIERSFTYFSLRKRLEKIYESVLRSVSSGDLQSAKQICQTEKSPLAELFLGSFDTQKSKEHAQRVTDRNRIRLLDHLKQNLWVLGTIATSSPFIGLFGTVLGILRAFHEMAEKGTGGFTVVASGISEALIATAFGLIVAILALLSYNFFLTKANQTITFLRLNLDEILDLSFEEKKIG